MIYIIRRNSKMPGLYKIADALLVTLGKKPYANMTIPGKVQSYMTVGKLIIGAMKGTKPALSMWKE